MCGVVSAKVRRGTGIICLAIDWVLRYSALEHSGVVVGKLQALRMAAQILSKS